MRYKFLLPVIALFIQTSASAGNGIAPDSKEVVIALIDTGIDTSETKILNLLKRDSKGDIAGWNFLGNRDNTHNPSSIGKESFRIMQLFHEKYSDVADTAGLSGEEKTEYLNYRFFRSRARIDVYVEFAKLLEYNNNAFNYMDSVIVSQKGNNDIRIADLNSIDYSMIPDSMETPLSQVMSECTKALYSGKTMWKEALENTRQEFNLSVQRISSLGNPRSNPRFSLDDDPYDFGNLNYGNDNVFAAPKENATAILSILESYDNSSSSSPMKVLPLRVAAAGEAFDKDIYAAILYAAHNGADIILIPQAKEYSLHGAKLTEALAYAGSKGITVVVGAGDSSMEINEQNAVPCAIYNGERLENVIRVGALDNEGKRLKGANHGAVDVFVTGVSADVSGSGVAAANVAGALYVMLSSDPGLSPEELRVMAKKLDGKLSNLESLAGTIK